VTDAPPPDLPDRRLHAYRPDLAEADLVGRVQAARFTAGEPARVVVGRASLKEEPRPSARQGSELLFGEDVTVFERISGFGGSESGGDWAWVKNATDGYVGYVAADALGPAGPPPTHWVVNLRSYLFPEPDLKSVPLGMLHLTSRVVAVQARDGWMQVKHGTGTAWLWARHLDRLKARARDPIATARRFMGAPYGWGGRSTDGLDCSALVQLALDRCGIACPRDSDMQEAALGDLVDGGMEAARPGDLLYWPGHVAFLVGGGRILHANAHHMAVAEEKLSEFRERTLDRVGEVRTVRRVSWSG